MNFIDELKSRSLFAQATYEEELSEHLNSPRTAYAGFDPTAKSLHAGHLLPIVNLMRWQKAGHRPVILIGGGTGYIGDPSGKTAMRSMLTLDDLQKNINGITEQLSKYIDLSSPDKGIVVNNADWLKPLNYLDFLRDFGPYFNVNKMLSAECYKSRMEDGLTFLEFNYMLLQSYDFYHLFKNEKCTIQLGGDDQWSNMIGGVGLIRKLEQEKAFCVTCPLLTTSDGKKMGKTEAGALWLDKELTPVYDFFQYWRNTADADVSKCLNYLTFLEISEIKRLSNLEGAAINEAKEVLAYEVTKLVHGEVEAKIALEQAKSVFSSKTGSNDAPEVAIDGSDFEEEILITDILATVKICPSKKEARRMVEQGAISINGEKVTDVKLTLSKTRINNEEIIIKKGKKNFFKLILN